MSANENKPKITLFHGPFACSLVTRNALEEAGVCYDVHVINAFTGQHKSPEYLAINPEGKLPALRIGNHVLTENAAILHFLNAAYPDAGLLPVNPDTLANIEPLRDLVWCSATLHPMTRQVRMPIRFTLGETDGVRGRGLELWQPMLLKLQDRFAAANWWYGERWSIVDVYIFWNYTTASNGGLDLAPYPAIIRHAESVRSYPSFQRTARLDREAFELAGIQIR